MIAQGRRKRSLSATGLLRQWPHIVVAAHGLAVQDPVARALDVTLALPQRPVRDALRAAAHALQRRQALRLVVPQLALGLGLRDLGLRMYTRTF